MENTEMMFWILWNSIKYGNYGIQILGNQKALWRQWPRDGFVRVQLSPDNCPPRHGGIIFPENSEFQKIWKIWTMELRFYRIWKISKIRKICLAKNQNRMAKPTSPRRESCLYMTPKKLPRRTHKVIQQFYGIQKIWKIWKIRK